MSERTIYIAQAGPKQERAVLESTNLERWQAEKEIERWKDDFVGEDWWFSISEGEVTI